MHLKQLKLVGFKSFVDPTVVYFPSHLVAVVGPNGCGKSNIIDAVRWVLGESSARNLRGESMVDVIFNGSSSRKPIGQASVELIFDNSLGKLTGTFSNYGEISIKRVVTRSGDSSYYLNGGRCRKKDITDIFLGTGANARGYSIIGQGTISQLIEAKPEDIRIFLEEAAGVSQYKERRKEAISRIATTRDNLLRLSDIQAELDIQLQRLERQAQAAEQYLKLKNTEKQCRAEIIALKWREFDSQRKNKQQELHHLELECAEHASLKASQLRERELLHQQIFDFDEEIHQLQKNVFEIKTEIVRLEEYSLQRERENKRLASELEQTQIKLAENIKHNEVHFVHIKDMKTRLKQISSDRVLAQKQFLIYEKAAGKYKKEEYEWNIRWESLHKLYNSEKNMLQVTQFKFEHKKELCHKTQIRIEQLLIEDADCNIKDLQDKLHVLQKTYEQLEEAKHLNTTDSDALNELTHSNSANLDAILKQIQCLQDNHYLFNTQHAALDAAQKALCNNKVAVEDWTGIHRLFEVLIIDDQWRDAAEFILHDFLQAYVLSNIENCASQIKNLVSSGHTVVITKSYSSPNKHVLPRLIDKMSGQLPILMFSLEHIYLAENVSEAMEHLTVLEIHESIVTLDGFWLGPSWLKSVSKKKPDELGFLARKQQIAELKGTIEHIQSELDNKKKNRDTIRIVLQENNAHLDIIKNKLSETNENLRFTQNQLQNHQKNLEQAEARKKIIKQELDELYLILEELSFDSNDLQSRIESLNSSNKEYEQQLIVFNQEKLEWQISQSEHSKNLEQYRTTCHQLDLDFERKNNVFLQLQSQLSRDELQNKTLTERLKTLQLECLEGQIPLEDCKRRLANELIKYNEFESILAEKREQGLSVRLKYETCEKHVKTLDEQIKTTDALIATCRMDEHALSIKIGTQEEMLHELGFAAEILLEQLSATIDYVIHEKKLIQLHDKIKRLGAINLTAIEEYSIEKQRKMYLDNQYNDLYSALTSLESAIIQIDDETRMRLENTFNEVNESFKTLFPRLFGGGTAQLELTCENLLEAGIVVMAQPPGKRNSTIHLLSGGEKAMTAVALVFAIFQLNPSPFCMLDEVDAPLDDVNVERFCTMVKEMSDCVQFLFITHNKVTMELADHLMGVTMREPGVSRLVAVDVIQALAMG